jgi:HEPN domain-containing protein
MSERNKVVAETQRWLTYAQRDLNAAQTLLAQGDTFTQQVCFLAQQGAEKALKAGLIFEQVEFPFRHDLDMLRNLLPGDWHCHQDCPSLEELTFWAIEGRYPTATEEPTRPVAQAVLDLARRVLASVQGDLSQRGVSWPR